MSVNLIIGGGPAGAALATRLAQAGRDIVLLERTEGPLDKVCGEFISHEAASYLEGLGVKLATLGAVPLVAMRLCHAGGTSTISLPFPAMSVSRRLLDEALLERARQAGASVRRGAKVTDVRPKGQRWVASLLNADPVEADAAFLATGKHDLHSPHRPAGLQNDLVAFKQHWQLAPDQRKQLDRHVELTFFEGGYAGLQPIEEDHANLCLVVRRQRLREVGGNWRGLLESIRRESAHFHQRLTGAQPFAGRPLALSVIPYGYVCRRSGGLWRLGDQAAVIPSFSGDGISIALHSAELAAKTFLAGGPADRYQRLLARDVARQVLLATGLSQGMVRPAVQRLFSAVVRRWPRLLSTVALETRLPAAALASIRRAQSHPHVFAGS